MVTVSVPMGPFTNQEEMVHVAVVQCGILHIGTTVGTVAVIGAIRKYTSSFPHATILLL